MVSLRTWEKWSCTPGPDGLGTAEMEALLKELTEDEKLQESAH